MSKAITLTEKLAKRAEEKLNADYDALVTLLNHNVIAKRLRFMTKDRYEVLKTDSLDRLVHYSGEEKTNLFRDMLPECIERETNDFIKKVEEFSNQVKELHNKVNNY